MTKKKIKVVGPYPPAIIKLSNGQRAAVNGGKWVKVKKNTTLKDLEWIDSRRTRRYSVKGRSGKTYFITLTKNKFTCTCGKENCSHIKKAGDKFHERVNSIPRD